jgi:probable F420-dependent oxidoreductase
MQVGINFFFTGASADPPLLATAAESLGFESLWVPEHIAIPIDAGRPYHRGTGAVPASYMEMADPFVALACAAGATRTLRMATGVCLAAQRHPVVLAKTVASLDRFSDGRLIFGVGGGWFRDEVELFGVPFAQRWAALEECVGAMRTLWRTGEGRYEGRYVSFPRVHSKPLPATAGGPPVIIGASPTPASVRRIANWADGWLALFQDPGQVAQARLAIVRECELNGRDPDSIEISVLVMDASPALQDAYAEAGASRVVVQLYNNPGTELPFAAWEAQYARAAAGPTPSEVQTLRALEVVAARAGL